MVFSYMSWLVFVLNFWKKYYISTRLISFIIHFGDIWPVLLVSYQVPKVDHLTEVRIILSQKIEVIPMTDLKWLSTFWKDLFQSKSLLETKWLIVEKSTGNESCNFQSISGNWRWLTSASSRCSLAVSWKELTATKSIWKTFWMASFKAEIQDP
jgi:hypothetical protein